MSRLPRRRQAAAEPSRSGSALESQVPVAPSPRLSRRLLSLLYDALLLCAVLWCAALPLALVEEQLSVPHVRAPFQAYLALVAGAYFIWHWVRSGQTLAMKTWRLRLITRGGGRVTVQQAAVRYIVALAGLALFGITFLWALLDHEGLFLHDRIARTRIVDLRTD